MSKKEIHIVKHSDGIRIHQINMFEHTSLFVEDYEPIFANSHIRIHTHSCYSRVHYDTSGKLCLLLKPFSIECKYDSEIYDNFGKIMEIFEKNMPNDIKFIYKDETTLSHRMKNNKIVKFIANKKKEFCVSLSIICIILAYIYREQIKNFVFKTKENNGR